jgi:ubiquinone biosynthesis protein Coq4
MPLITQTFDLFTNYYLYSHHNNNARISNSMLTTATEAFTALVNPTDNTPIVGFPATPEAIGNMQAGTLNNVLRQLGLTVEGHTALKEQRLRESIGLKKNPA